MYVYQIFIHSSVDGHIGCFHTLAVENNASMNTGCIYLLELCSLDKHSRSRIAGQYGNSIFSAFKKLPYSFPYWLHQFVFPLTVHRGSLSPSPHQHLLFLVFLTIAILTAMWCYLIVCTFNLLQYCFCFVFWFLATRHVGS